MKTILTIQDLARDSELGAEELAAVRGGQGDQANGTSQANVLTGMASSNIGNGSLFYGSGPVTLQGDSKLDQHADNTNDSTNFKGLFALLPPVGC